MGQQTKLIPIYTSYYGFFRHFPNKYLMVSCSLNPPSIKETERTSFPWIHWKEISPTPQILMGYKNSSQEAEDIKKYIRSYVGGVLLPRKDGVYDDFMKIQKFADDKKSSSIFVCCFEKKETFCHRRVWAEYMYQRYGITIPEYKEYFELPYGHIDANLVLLIREEVKKIIQEEEKL